MRRFNKHVSQKSHVNFERARLARLYSRFLLTWSGLLFHPFISDTFQMLDQLSQELKAVSEYLVYATSDSMKISMLISFLHFS